jgi:hypothetical protein
MPARKNKGKNVSSDNASIKDADMDRLRKDIYRSDKEKLTLFTKMIRRNALYKKAIVTHK